MFLLREFGELQFKQIDEILCKMIAEGKPSRDVETEMEKYQVYKLDVPISQTDASIMSAPNDLICNGVNIYYDAQASEWIVSGGGWWQNTRWVGDVDGLMLGYLGETKNVGGFDSVGITYNNTNGSYTGVRVVSSMGYITD